MRERGGAYLALGENAWAQIRRPPLATLLKISTYAVVV